MSEGPEFADALERPGARSGKPYAVVTGASSGIGRALATQFAEHGFDLLVTAEDGLAEVEAELTALGARVRTVRADLRGYEGVETLWTEIQEIGPVDALALNAGVGLSGPFSEGDLQAELDLIAVNVTSQVHLARRVLPGMVERKAGRVLVTSSIAGTHPGPFEAIYSASKAFLLSFAQALRTELAETGVTVTALMPGPTDTEFFERADMLDTKIGAGPKDDPAEVAAQGFEAMMKGKDHVVTGSVKNRLMTAGAKVLPQTASARTHSKMSEPGSAD